MRGRQAQGAQSGGHLQATQVLRAGPHLILPGAAPLRGVGGERAIEVKQQDWARIVLINPPRGYLINHDIGSNALLRQRQDVAGDLGGAQKRAAGTGAVIAV